MDWVRGGSWKYRSMHFYVTPPSGISESASGRFHPQGGEPPDGWEETRGAALRMERYVLDDGQVGKILDDYERFTARFGSGFLGLPAIPGSDTYRGHASVEPTALQEWGEELAALTRRHGPLLPVRDVVEPQVAGRGGAHARTGAQPFAFSDREAAEEIDHLARVWTWIKVGTRDEADHARLLRALESSSTQALTEVSVQPLLAGGAVKYQVLPLSLRAFLWIALFPRAWRGGAGVCRYCGERFARERKQGRPPQFCAQHRAPKFHQAWREGRAPTQKEGFIATGSDDPEPYEEGDDFDDDPGES